MGRQRDALCAQYCCEPAARVLHLRKQGCEQRHTLRFDEVACFPAPSRLQGQPLRARATRKRVSQLFSQPAIDALSGTCAELPIVLFKSSLNDVNELVVLEDDEEENEDDEESDRARKSTSTSIISLWTQASLRCSQLLRRAVHIFMSWSPQ